MKNTSVPITVFKASDCGNSFVVQYSDGDYKYWYIGGKYYSQRITPIVKKAVEITRESYLQGCQYLKENISLCGSSFTTPFGDFTALYWFDGTYFYKQILGDIIKNLPVKISKQDFINACNSNF